MKDKSERKLPNLKLDTLRAETLTVGLNNIYTAFSFQSLKNLIHARGNVENND